MVLKISQLSRSHIKFVNNLISLMRQLRIDDRVHVRQELLTLSPEIERLHLFQVDQMVVLMLHNRHRLRSLAHFCLSVL